MAELSRRLALTGQLLPHFRLEAERENDLHLYFGAIARVLRLVGHSRSLAPEDCQCARFIGDYAVAIEIGFAFHAREAGTVRALDS